MKDVILKVGSLQFVAEIIMEMKFGHDEQNECFFKWIRQGGAPGIKLHNTKSALRGLRSCFPLPSFTLPTSRSPHSPPRGRKTIFSLQCVQCV